MAEWVADPPMYGEITVEALQREVNPLLPTQGNNNSKYMIRGIGHHDVAFTLNLFD
jgi:hypothetical protein